MVTSPLFRMRSSAPTCRTIFIPSRLPPILSPPGLRFQTWLPNQWMQRQGQRIHYPRLVQEVPHARKHHRESQPVGGGYNIGVTDGTARLDYGSRAGLA